MSIEKILIEIEGANDPERCQSNLRSGQCGYKRRPDSIYCPRHDGCSAGVREAKNKNQYFLGKWQGQADRFANDSEIKNLRSEIGLARTVMENILSLCNDATDMLMYSSKIGDLLTRIERLVVACHRMEEQTGKLLDKSTVIILTQQIINIVSNRIQDPLILESISNDILEAVTSANNHEQFSPAIR